MVKALRRAMAGEAPVETPPPVAERQPPTPRRGTSAASRAAPGTRRTSPVVWILAGIAAVLIFVIGALLLIAIDGDNGGGTSLPTTTAIAVVDTATSAPTATEEPGATEGPAATEEPAATTAAPPPTATDSQEPPTATTVPTNTPQPPTHTPTSSPPTATPVPPTPTCAVAVDAQLASAWDRSLVGCPTAPAGITWAAWEPFERGHMFWRDDQNVVYVLSFQNGNKSTGQWQVFTDQWDGTNPDGVGLSPPPGLYEPKRGFGWLWRTRLDGPDSVLGWARDEEKGFCAKIQPFENGRILHSSTVQTCKDDLYNWATHPSFPPLFFALHGDGTWRRY
jgi:hypothetical protein